MLQQIISQLNQAEQRALGILLVDSQFVSDSQLTLKKAEQDKFSQQSYRYQGTTKKGQKKISRQLRAYYRKKLRKKVAHQIKKSLEKN